MTAEPERVPGPGRAGVGLLSSFTSLLAAQVIGAVLGLLFWILVARLVSTHEVGVAAASINTQTLLGSVTSLGIGTLLISELPLQGEGARRRIVLRGLVACAVASLVVGALMVAGAPLIGGTLQEALAEPEGALLFTVGVGAAAACLVIDQAGLGVMKPGVQVGRNLLASGLRFPLAAGMLAMGTRDATVLQLCWVAPLLLSLVVSWRRLRLRRTADPRPSLRSDLRGFGPPALRNHALNLALAAGSQLVPVVAAVTLISVDNAAFAIAWLVASFGFLPPYLLATALFAHGANLTLEQFRRTMQSTLPAALMLSLGVCVGAWLFDRYVMGIFGDVYAEQSAMLLSLLVPAGLWMVVKDHLVALWRTQHLYRTGVALTTLSLAVEVTGAALGAVVGGATGLCLGWLVAMAVEVALFLPWMRRAFGGLAWQWPLSREGVSRLRGTAAEG